MLKALRRHWVAVAASGIAVVVVAALLIPHVLRRRRAARARAVVAAMVRILDAQATFHKADYYGKGTLTYASPHVGRGFEDLHEIIRDDGSVLAVRLIPRSIAKAVDPEHAHGGYYFMDLLRAPSTPKKVPAGFAAVATSPTPDYEPAVEFGICAIPYPYTPGQKTFVMTTGGTVYARSDSGVPDDGFAYDTGGKPPAECYPRQ